MRCPHAVAGKVCGAPSEVLTTRAAHATLQRRRECFNGHRFTTQETLVQILARGERDERIVDMVARGFSRQEVADQFNVSRNTVYLACMNARKAQDKNCGT